ncbi:MAG TPA: CHAP domain-containing protein [Candidatus Saccharimonadales bacterium]|nr:CHAP domain-containing protein [Candidatus Saccharimonadales bacterium]
MKQKIPHNRLVRRLKTVGFAGVLSVLVLSSIGTHGFGAFAATCSTASDCQQQISDLNAQNAQAQSALGGLQAQASSYQDAIARLQSQINVLQGQISTNQAQQQALQAQMDANQAELDRDKTTLANAIKTMYVDGQPTTLEMLASSGSMSDFVDKEQYRTDVQKGIQDTLRKITDLQKKLATQKAAIDQLVRSLQDQQSQVAAAQSEQNSLLAMNQSQQATYNAQIQANKQALSQLYAKQAAIIAASFGGGLHYGGTGNYPWPNASCLNASGNCGPYSESPYNWGMNGQPYDLAGWQYRNCTSYAFWRLAQVTGITLTAASFPHVYNSGGRIGQSLPDFQNLGYRVDHDPNGDAVLAVNTAGNFGHIMYVEAVVNDQAVVSQYNAAGDGLYSTGTLGTSSSIWFIHVR